jgi:hypothetical protein
MLSLDEAIAAARRALVESREGAIERGYREQIWAALGPRDTNGRTRRALLAIRSVEHAMDAWKEANPADDTPAKLLAIARRVLAGQIDRETAFRERGTAWTHFDDLDGGAVEVGYAAAQALGTALADEDFTEDAVNIERRDADLDPYEQDAAYLVSLVVAGGPVWGPSDPQRRRAFWDWWLTDAVTEVR